VAARAGTLIARMHTRSAQDPLVASQFADRTAFWQLRVEPYYETVARVHPDLRPRIEAAVERMWNTRVCLVHGDYSPKNLLVYDGDRLLLIDHEMYALRRPGHGPGLLPEPPAPQGPGNGTVSVPYSRRTPICPAGRWRKWAASCSPGSMASCRWSTCATN
jgi:hypothetical protein